MIILHGTCVLCYVSNEPPPLPARQNPAFEPLFSKPKSVTRFFYYFYVPFFVIFLLAIPPLGQEIESRVLFRLVFLIDRKYQGGRLGATLATYI